MALLRRVRIRAYRSAADVELELGRVAALVGEARAGKSNLLRAVRALLDPTARVDPGDVRRNEDGALTVEAELDDGRKVSLRARPPEASAEREGAPPVVFLPAGLRGETLVEASPGAEQAARAFEAAAKEHRGQRVRGRRRRRARRRVRGLLRGRRLRRRLHRRGARALPAPAHAALSVPPAARARRRGEPGALLDARAGLPERRPPGRAGARGPRPRTRHARRPAASRSSPRRRSGSSASSTPSGASSSSRVRRSSSRGGRRSSSSPPSSPPSATTRTARRSRSSSAAASRTSRSSPGSARPATSRTSSSTTATRSRAPTRSLRSRP